MTTTEFILFECAKRARARLRQLGDSAVYLNDAIDLVQKQEDNKIQRVSRIGDLESELKSLLNNKG